MSFVTECSDGGNSHMGTAHSDPSQGRCLQLLGTFFPFFSLLSSSLFVSLRYPYPSVGLMCSAHFPLCLTILCTIMSLLFLFWESGQYEQDVQHWNNSQGAQMAGNKAKEDRNQHTLPYFFFSLPSCWLYTAEGKEGMNDNLGPCAFCPVCSHTLLIDCTP